MAKVQIKSDKITPFGGIFSITKKFTDTLRDTIDSTLGLRCEKYGYRYSEIIRSLMCVFFCGGSCVEDVTSHLMRHLLLDPKLRTCSADTILRAIKELEEPDITYTSEEGKDYHFNKSERLNGLLLEALFRTGQLEKGGEYDLDFDHQYIETEKYDCRPTYKKFLGYGPGVATIGDMIVGIENRDGNTNVRFHQRDTLERIIRRLEGRGIRINRFRADCGSYSKDVITIVESHSKNFYIRASKCSSLYDEILSIGDWKQVRINETDTELSSITVTKWNGREYRLFIQRERRKSKRSRKPKRLNTRFEPPRLANGETLVEALTRCRMQLSMSREKWSATQEKRAEFLFELYPKLEDTYNLINSLRDVFRNKKLTKETAKKKLGEWYEKVAACTLREIKSVRDTIRLYEDEILNYFVKRQTNASAESLNSKIKCFRAQVKGVRDIPFFMYRLATVFG